MPVTVLAIVFMLAAVALEAAVRPRGSRAGWPWFAAWAGAGVLAAFASVSFVGLLVLPFALVAIFAVSRFALWPEALGLAAGAGITAVAIAALNLARPAVGGPDPQAWLLGGALAIAASALAYAALAASRGPRRRSAAPPA